MWSIAIEHLYENKKFREAFIGSPGTVECFEKKILGQKSSDTVSLISFLLAR